MTNQIEQALKHLEKWLNDNDKTKLNEWRSHMVKEAFIGGYKSALEALEKCEPVGYVSQIPIKTPQAIRSDANDVFKYAVYTSPQPIEKCEPVAEVRWRNGEMFAKFKTDFIEAGTKLYTSPQPIEKCEPVAWMWYGNQIKDMKYFEPFYGWDSKPEFTTAKEIYPLYTSPQHRDWNSIHDDDITDIATENYNNGNWDIDFARAIEAKLKELNT